MVAIQSVVDVFNLSENSDINNLAIDVGVVSKLSLSVHQSVKKGKSPFPVLLKIRRWADAFRLPHTRITSFFIYVYVIQHTTATCRFSIALPASGTIYQQGFFSPFPLLSQTYAGTAPFVYVSPPTALPDRLNTRTYRGHPLGGWSKQTKKKKFKPSRQLRQTYATYLVMMIIRPVCLFSSNNKYLRNRFLFLTSS